MKEIINELDLENVSGGVAPAGSRSYVFAKGDCLPVIAQKNGMTLSSLCKYNNISDPSKVKPGDVIFLPLAISI